jgi:hypothetical protein
MIATAIVFTDSAIPAYIDQLARPPAEERLVAGRPYHIYRVARTGALSRWLRNGP